MTFTYAPAPAKSPKCEFNPSELCPGVKSNVYETMTLFQMKTLHKVKNLMVKSTKDRFIEQNYGESLVAEWRNYLTLLLNRQPLLLGMISSGSPSGLYFTYLVTNSL